MDQEVIEQTLAGLRKQAASLEVQLLAVRASIAALEAEQPQTNHRDEAALNRAIMDQRIKDAAAVQ